MKIGFDAKRLFHNYTGLGNYSRTLVENLATLYPLRNYALFTEKVSDKEEVQEFLTQKYKIVKPRNKSKLWRIKGMTRDIIKHRIDIYHGLSHDLPYGIKRTGAKSVVTIHDVCYKTFPKMFPWSERLIYSLKYRHSCKTADKIIAISKSTKNDIIKYFNVPSSKIEVIYQAINEQFYESMSKEDAREIVNRYRVADEFLLYVGSLNSRKNFMGVIQAYAKLEATHRVQLVVIGGGRGKYYQQCIKEAERLGVREDIVFFSGITSMQSLQAFYTAAECLIYPSFYEGFGLPVTEAILSRCPVVTSNVSSLPEAGGSVAKYVNPESSDEIARAINEIIDWSEQEREEITERGREEALKKFDPKKLTKKVAKLYKKMLADESDF